MRCWSAPPDPSRNWGVLLLTSKGKEGEGREGPERRGSGLLRRGGGGQGDGGKEGKEGRGREGGACPTTFQELPPPMAVRLCGGSISVCDFSLLRVVPLSVHHRRSLARGSKGSRYTPRVRFERLRGLYQLQHCLVCCTFSPWDFHAALRRLYSTQHFKFLELLI